MRLVYCWCAAGAQLADCSGYLVIPAEIFGSWVEDIPSMFANIVSLESRRSSPQKTLLELSAEKCRGQIHLPSF